MINNLSKSIINYTHFGEIVQGVFKSVSNSKCAISFPININKKKINLYRKKEYYKDGFKFADISCVANYNSNNKFSITPRKYLKSKLLINLLIKKYKIKKINGNIEVINKIPVCRGLGSSTASLVSVVSLIKKLTKIKISKYQILKLCASIEPTDPILINDICLFSTIEGSMKKKLNFKLPKLIIYGIDTDLKGGGINTVKMKDINYSRSELLFFEKSLKKLLKLKRYDEKVLSKICLKSLKINQKYYPKKKFDEVMKLERYLTNDFVIGAHSGTMMGFVYKYEKNSGKKFKAKDEKILNLISKKLNSPIIKYLYV